MVSHPPLSFEVHEGVDGWLFLVGGSNDPLRLYRRSFGNTLLATRWSRLIHARLVRAERLGIRYLHVPVPEKLSIYADKAPGLAVDPRLRAGQAVVQGTLGGGSCLDLVPVLAAAREDGDVFLRTDSHWSSLGCKAAHDAICRAMGARLRWSFAERRTLVVPDFTGDLGAKLEPPRSEALERRMVARDAGLVEANELVRWAEAERRLDDVHRGARVVFRNDAPDADPRCIVLCGDSCANFASHGLTAMLAETFREVHFLWSAAVDWTYVERIRPAILLTEIAERFTTRVPSDGGFDIDALARRRLADMGAAPSR
jgi:alginate O-acetyltransferase complex protein AlgJ